MKIVAFADCNEDLIDLIVEDEGDYKRLSSLDGKPFVQETAWTASDYKSYGHFAGVVGKFDPYVVFLSEPVEVERLTHAAARDVYEKTLGK
jgi:hypothetical protein